MSKGSRIQTIANYFREATEDEVIAASAVIQHVRAQRGFIRAGGEAGAQPKPKQKRHRRTKKEMEAAREQAKSVTA